MGTTYHYANLTKCVWFSTDALGGNPKLRGLGLNLTARAFELLLVRGFPPTDPDGPVRIGRWAGDSVAIIGDSDEEWLSYYQEFVDLTADVILLVVSHDGFDRVGDAAAEDTGLFVQLCHFIMTQQSPELVGHMRQRFGGQLFREYRKRCSVVGGFVPKDIARPG